MLSMYQNGRTRKSRCGAVGNGLARPTEKKQDLASCQALSQLLPMPLTGHRARDALNKRACGTFVAERGAIYDCDLVLQVCR